MDASDPFGDNDFGFGTNGGFGTGNVFGDEDLGIGTNPSNPSTTGSFDLGSLFNPQQSYGVTDPFGDNDFGFSSPSNNSFGVGDPFGDNDLGFSPNVSPDFSLDDLSQFDFDSINGKNGKGKSFNPASFIMGLGKLALASNPITAPGFAAFSLGKGVFDAVQSGNVGGLAGTAIGTLTGNSTLGNIAGMGINGMSGGNPSGQAGGMAGGMIGNAIAGSIGGMFGSDIGSSLTGGMTSDGPPAGVANGDGPNIDPGMILSGLGSLYLANQAGNDAKTLANNQTPQSAQGIAGAAGVPTLESMFGPDSAYAQNMRKQLERRDAAKGRRSQYGPREVELQAKLAELASRAAPDYIRATSAAQTAGNTNQQTVNTAQRAADEQRLKILYTLGRESGLFKELGGLFKQQPTQPLPTNYLTNDWMQPAGNTDFGVNNIDPSYQPSTNFYDYGQDL